MQNNSKSVWIMLMAALLLLIICMGIIPFYDTSEPRYAQIARVMAESGDWITPWFSPGVPFWGKPPLSFWAQALSMKAFGFTEFAARFPSLMCLILSIGALFAGLRRLEGACVGLWAALVYTTCALVYVSSAAVVTDPFLALGTTLSMVSFAVSVRERNCGWWPYGFFLGLVIGLLAKGPLAAVLSFAPVAVWYVFNRKTTALGKALPWGKGMALVAALTLPWYILAEAKTPGFLDYFIVGEHFRRFLDPGWQGDLYGWAHKRTYGTIWLYWLQASFPWGVLMLAAMAGALRSVRLRAALKTVGANPLFSFWMASTLVTPLFFTFSANILLTYVLPSLAGFSVLAALVINQSYGNPGVSSRRLLPVAGLIPVVGLVFSVIVWINPNLHKTERELIRYTQQRGDAAIPLAYLSEPPFSAQFYSGGRVRTITQSDLAQPKNLGAPFYLAIPKNQQTTVAELLGKPLEQLYANKRYVLVKIE